MQVSPNAVAGASVEQRLAYSVMSLAQALEVSPATIRGAIGRGDLKATRLGRRVLVLRSDALAWLSDARQGNR
jgi:excisionase family DNA binding protein